MGNTINERLKDFQKRENFKWVDLQEKLKILNLQTVTNWTKEKDRDPIPLKHILRIIELYENLNARWFITGKGNMLNDEKDVASEPPPPYNTIESLKDKIETLIREIEGLKNDKEFLQQIVANLSGKAGCPPGELEGGVEKSAKTG